MSLLRGMRVVFGGAMMPRSKAPSALLLSTVIALTGCASDGDQYGDALGDDLEEGSDGKADAGSNVVVTSHDLALYSASMKALLCASIADAEPAFARDGARTSFLGRCKNFSFRVREQARSTLYAGLDSSTPLTMWMRVAVSGTDGEWATCATRAWNPESLAFDWRGSVDVSANPIDAHIEAIADDPEGHEDDIRLRSFSTMPTAIKAAANAWVADELADLLAHSSEDPETINVAIYTEQNASLLLDGTVVGYRVEVAMTQGNGDGGALLYYNKAAELIAAPTEWF